MRVKKLFVFKGMALCLLALYPLGIGLISQETESPPSDERSDHYTPIVEEEGSSQQAQQQQQQLIRTVRGQNTKGKSNGKKEGATPEASSSKKLFWQQ